MNSVWRSIRMILMSIVSLLIGGMIGAGVALLYAPQSGRATRAMIRSKGIELKERAVEEVNLTRTQAVGRVNRMSRQIQNQATQLSHQLQDLVEDQQSALKEAVSAIPTPFHNNGH